MSVTGNLPVDEKKVASAAAAAFVLVQVTNTLQASPTASRIFRHLYQFKDKLKYYVE